MSDKLKCLEYEVEPDQEEDLLEWIYNKETEEYYEFQEEFKF
jgi:hypothetical protein